MEIDTTNMLRPQQVAERLGMTATSIYRAIKEGRLEAVDIAGRLFVSKDAFEAWATEREQSNSAGA